MDVSDITHTAGDVEMQVASSGTNHEPKGDEENVPETSHQANVEEDGLGKTVLPIAKVKRIMKIDPNYTPCSESAVFVIAKSTEYFIKHLAMKAHMNTKIEKRQKLQYRDFSSAVQNHEDLLFLKRMVPPLQSVRKLTANDQISYSKTRSHLSNTIGSKKDIGSSKQSLESGESPEKDIKVKEKVQLEKGQQVLNFKRAKLENENKITLEQSESSSSDQKKDGNDDLEDSEPEYSEGEDEAEPMQVDDEINNTTQQVDTAKNDVANVSSNSIEQQN